MKITEDHRLVNLGWTDANFWDGIFDSTADKKPAVETLEKTNGNLLFPDILENSNDTYYSTLFFRLYYYLLTLFFENAYSVKNYLFL